MQLKAVLYIPEAEGHFPFVLDKIGFQHCLSMSEQLNIQGDPQSYKLTFFS